MARLVVTCSMYIHVPSCALHTHAIGFNGAGLSIGLDVARELVEAHGGNIAAKCRKRTRQPALHHGGVGFVRHCPPHRRPVRKIERRHSEVGIYEGERPAWPDHAANRSAEPVLALAWRSGAVSLA